VEAPGVESSRGISVSIGLARFLAEILVDKVRSLDAHSTVSMGLDRSTGRKVENAQIVLERLGKAFVSWALSQDPIALRRGLLEILELTLQET
jgi:hypothetical protein